jgi:hypothetical protein
MTEINVITFVAALLLDVISTFLLSYVFYYRRHRNREMTIAIAVINIALFSLSGALASYTLSLGVGFALFAVISIIRLRSDEAGWLEMAYLLAGLSVGLILGLPGFALTVQAIYSTILILAVYLIDHPKLLAPSKARKITLTVDFVETDTPELVNRVSKIVGGKVLKIETKAMVVSPPSMKLDVRYAAK